MVILSQTDGNVFCSPLVVDEKLYVIPLGYANKKDEGTLLEINIFDLGITKHTIEQLAMNSVAASGKFVYIF